MCHQAAWCLPHDLASIALARRLLRSQLDAWASGLDEVGSAAVEDLKLVCSELVTNAVKFSSGSVGLTICVHRERLEIGVSDDSDVPARTVPGSEAGTGGRGIMLVEALSRQWGQDVRVGGGKTVWAHVDLSPASVLGQTCQL